MAKRLYGGDETIHNTEHLDVEVDANGSVVAVWFRCMSLPFVQHEVADHRAEGQREYPADVKLLGVEIDDR